jgi:hypothetical protein
MFTIHLKEASAEKCQPKRGQQKRNQPKRNKIE